MKRTCFLLLTVVALTPTQGHAQTGEVAGTRLVEVRVQPEEPALGQQFDLLVTLRVPPSTVALLPDTLVPTEAVQSTGPGAWTEVLGPGDSVDIEVTYPVIGFLAGAVELPTLELSVREAGPDEGTGPIGRRGSEARTAAQGRLETGIIGLGAWEIAPFLPSVEEGVPLAPRPPADVLGGEWSLWLLLAVGVGLTAAVAGTSLLALRWWRAGGAALVARLQGRSPRQDALRELERIRSLAWHRNGRMVDFYASSTDTLRRFAERLDPSWGGALTSNELVGKLEERWGEGGTDALAAAVGVAERVKFGSYRPEPEAAESDWEAIRDWVRRAPEE